jgi:hypothetical protein
VKTCRKCGAIIPKGKHLCANCKRRSFYICVLCGKRVGNIEDGQVFCHACWRKIATKKEISKLILKNQQYEMLISTYEKMMDTECKMNEELREKNADLKKELEYFHEKSYSASTTRIDIIYSKHNALPTSDDFRVE